MITFDVPRRQALPDKHKFLAEFVRGFDSDYFPAGAEVVRNGPKVENRHRYTTFIILHTGALGVLFCGWSVTAVVLCVALYFVRMFAVTAFYHRYFSHRTFKTSRLMQFIFAVWGLTAVQRGPLWWASHHRLHHKYSDLPEDSHSPKQRGFWWSHMGWISCDANIPTDYERVADLSRYPELIFLNRFDRLVPISLAVLLFFAGLAVSSFLPALGTSCWQFLFWGFFVSTVFLFHGTASINSLSHVFGSQRYKTDDTSRNNFWLALVTLGEGWHNNHHRFQGAVRQGFYWWEIDITYYLLKALAWLGLIYDLHPVPAAAYLKENQLS